MLITQEVDSSFISKEGDIRYSNSFRLNKICKPLTIMDSFSMIPGFNSYTAITLYGKIFNFSHTLICAIASPTSSCFTDLLSNFDKLHSIESEMFTRFSTVSLYGHPFCSASNTEPVSPNFSINL